MNEEYLKGAIGTPLMQCLGEVVEKQPRDPIEWMAQWLYRYVDKEIYFFEKAIFLKDLHRMQLELEKEKQRRQNCINSLALEVLQIKLETKEDGAAMTAFLLQKMREDGEAAGAMGATSEEELLRMAQMLGVPVDSLRSNKADMRMTASTMRRVGGRGGVGGVGGVGGAGGVGGVGVVGGGVGGIGGEGGWGMDGAGAGGPGGAGGYGYDSHSTGSRSHGGHGGRAHYGRGFGGVGADGAYGGDDGGGGYDEYGVYHEGPGGGYGGAGGYGGGAYGGGAYGGGGYGGGAYGGYGGYGGGMDGSGGRSGLNSPNEWMRKGLNRYGSKSSMSMTSEDYKARLGIQKGQSKWCLDCNLGLICDHSVLGQIRSSRAGFVCPETPVWWEVQDYTMQSLYDHEIYTTAEFT